MDASDLVLVYLCWPSSPERGLLPGGAFSPLPLRFCSWFLVGQPSSLPERGTVLFPVPAVLISPQKFPGVETASVRQSTALHCFETE